MIRGRAGAIVLGAFAGASIWISAGLIAVTSARGARVGALPSFSAALALLAGGAIAALALRVRAPALAPVLLCAALWLPWLPFDVPAAFMAFEGPLEALVWAAVAGGCLWNIAGERLSAAVTPLSTPRAAMAGGIVIAATLSIAAAYGLSDRLPGGDEPHYLVITQSLLHDGDLRIQNNHERGDYFQYISQEVRPDFLKRGADGQIYSLHAPGISALVLPAFVLGGYPAVVVFIALFTAAGAALFWDAVRRLTGDPTTAWAGWAALVSSAPWFSHSYTVFPDGAGAAAVAAGVWLLVRLERERDAVGTGALAFGGAALALLPWLHSRLVFVAAAFGIFILARLFTRADRWRAMAAFIGPPAVSALGWFAFFWIVYGSPSPKGPYGDVRQNALEWLDRGLSGLLFDQQFGVIAASPVLALALVGGWWMLRERRRLLFELLVIATPYVLLAATFQMWWGGFAGPGRIVTAVIPCAALAAAIACQRGGPALRSAFVVLVALSAVNLAARAALLDGALMFNVRDGYDLLLDWVAPSVNLPLALPSVHRDGPAAAALDGAVWVVCGILAVGVATLLFNARPQLARRALLIAVAIFAASSILAATIVLSQRPARAFTPSSSQLSFLQRGGAADGRVAFAMPGFEPLSAQDRVGRMTIGMTVRGVPNETPGAFLHLTSVPAGEYLVELEGRRQPAGTLHVSIGFTSQPMEQWDLSRTPPADLRLRLPVAVHSVTIRADEAAAASVRRVALRPQRVEAPAPGGGYALRATRYGSTRVFGLDDNVMLEPGGLWVRAKADGRLVIATDDDDVAQVDVAAGPVAERAHFSAEGWRVDLDLAPGQRVRQPFPSAAIVTVRTEGGFRPRDYDAGSRDERRLGVRMEFPLR